jgi:hypothetical protein
MKKIRFLVLTLFASILVLNFQNCGGGMAPLSGIVEQQSISDIDSSSIPRLLTSGTYVYRNTNGVVTTNHNPALSETASVVLVFDRSITGYIYRHYASDSIDEARISVEASGVIRVWHISTGTSYTYADVPLPDASLGNRVTVAASFGIGANAVVLLVNGLKQNLTFQKAGSPYDFSYVQKTVVLAGTSGVLLDVATFSEAISNLDLNVMSRYMANALGVINVAFDSSLINDTTVGSGLQDSAEFLAAKTVIDSNCLGCHNSSNYGDFRNLSQAQYIAKGLVVSQNPGASKIYYRLTGALSGAGPATMPQGAAALPASDVAKIATWINSIH